MKQECHVHLSNAKSLIPIINLIEFIYIGFIRVKYHLKCLLEGKKSNFVNALLVHEPEIPASEIFTNEPDSLIIKSQSTESMLEVDIASFYLTLQGKSFIPKSVIQLIIDTYIGIHCSDLSMLKKVLLDKLSQSDFHLDDLQIRLIIEEVFDNDFLTKMHSEFGPFRSIYSRECYFHRNPHYNAPSQHCLGQSSRGGPAYFHTVDIKKSIENLLNDKYAKHVFKSPINTSMSIAQPSNLYSDYTNGNFYTPSNNQLDILIYQDELELVNPLSSGKGINKITAFYFTLGQVNPTFRSECDQIQLALLCKSTYIVQFGINRVLQPLINQLKKLYDNGITYLSKKFKCQVHYMAGDHLGHHIMGGFQRNFSNGVFVSFVVLILMIYNVKLYFRNAMCLGPLLNITILLIVVCFLN